MTLMTNQELKMIESRCNQISSDRWEICKVEVGDLAFYDVVTNGNSDRPTTKEECEFIANARADIPKLIQHINNLQEMLHQFHNSQEELLDSLF